MRQYIRIATAALASILLVTSGAPVPLRAASGDAPRESRYVLAPFGRVALYRPVNAPRATALFLSGDGGWNAGAARMARMIARRGILVAGVSTPALMKALERSGAGACINPNYALIDLARDVEHRAGVGAYMKPILIGYSAGATIAYASLAQWPNGDYRGIFSLGFSADTTGRKPWCHAPGFHARPVERPAHGWLFAPNRTITLPWVVLQGGQDTVVPFAPARHFAAAVPHARFIALPRTAHDFADDRQWLPPLVAAITPMLDPVRRASSPGLPQDMPISIVPASPNARQGDVMAVLYSGDGGWVGLDRDLAGQIAAKGIPVVGIDSLSYFWRARTPAGAGQDLQRIITGYGNLWHRPRVMLIGYSFGADALPAMVGTLNPATRAHIDSVSLLGLSSTADFQFHLASWLDIATAQSQPTLPSVERLRGMAIRCVRGTLETDSACPAIPAGLARQFIVPGGHHFNRNAPLLARLLLSSRA